VRPSLEDIYLQMVGAENQAGEGADALRQAQGVKGIKGAQGVNGINDKEGTRA
jgi:hypothetical protein